MAVDVGHSLHATVADALGRRWQAAKVTLRVGYCLPISHPSPRQRVQVTRSRKPVPSQSGHRVQSSALGRQMIRPPHGAPFEAGRKHMTVLSKDPV